MIKLEALRVFVAVAEAGNIKDAALRLCRTASAVSMSLKQLELVIGGSLFETDYKDRMTALGRFVFETASTQIEGYDQAIGRIRDFADNRMDRLALASVPSVASNLVPLILPLFIRERPKTSLELFDLDSRNVWAFVESGQASIGISGQPSNSDKLLFEPLFRDRFQIVCCEKNPLAGLKRPVMWGDLESQKLIRNGASDKLNSREYEQLAGKASLRVRNLTSLIALTKAEIGVTLLPALTTTDLPAGVTSVSFEDDYIGRIVGFVTRKRISPDPVTMGFRQVVLNIMPELAKQFGFDLVGR